MEKFTLETGLEESALELQEAFKTLYEAMISADEQEVLIQQEGAVAIDKLQAMHEANLEALKNAIKSVWSWFLQKIHAFGKLIKEWYSRMRKKLTEYMAMRNINFNAEIEWYADTSDITKRLEALHRVLGPACFKSDEYIMNNFDKEAAKELLAELRTAPRKEKIKASECKGFNNKDEIKRNLKVLDGFADWIEQVDSGIGIARSSLDEDPDIKDPTPEKVAEFKEIVKLALDMLMEEKKLIVDLGSTLFKALVKMGMKHTPEQDAKFGTKEESMIDQDLALECVFYEFDHIMDDCYVLPTGDLINGTAA